MENNEKERPLTYMKRADVMANRVILPKFFIEKFGRDFYMEVYYQNDGKIILTPIKKEEE